MPNNPYEPDDIKDYEGLYRQGSDRGKPVHYEIYDVTIPKTPEEMTEYLKDIPIPDPDNTRLYVHYEIIREDGTREWKSSVGVHPGYEENYDIWEMDLADDMDTYGGVGIGGYSAVVITG